MTKGERIRKRREELLISQTELAKRVGITKHTLYKYESNIITNIPSDNLERIAKELDVSPSYIFGWTDAAGQKTEYGALVEAYSKSSETKEFIDLFEQADSSVRQTVLNFLKSAPHDP